ncbi:MAG TPA: glycosyltransferase family 39 protein [Terriglobales bacterium]|nr:glycosyltransferase family 39 protein [Terriglobales bacterium]
MASSTAQLDAHPLKTKSSRVATAAILLLYAVIYFGSTFSPALQDDADSTHAEAAREMVVRGDWVTLHVNGIRYLEKAPFLYWTVALSYSIFGANAFATRLPTAIAMLLLILLAMKWARRAYGERASIYAGLFVCTAAGYYLFTRILIPEAILGLFIGASLYSFLTALDEPKSGWRWYAGYALLALAVLTKGLLAPVAVGMPLAGYLLLSGEWRRWREFRIVTGLLLFFVIAAPWHLLAGYRNERFFWFYFVNEHFLRFLGRRYPRDYNKLPGVLYWSLHLVWLFPWSMYLPVAVRNAWHELRSARTAEPDSGKNRFRSRTQLLCWIWAGVILTFFAFSTNQEYYTVPVYLPVLLLIAGALAQEEERKSKLLIGMTAVMAVLSLASAGVLAAGLYVSRHLPFVTDIGTVLAKPDSGAETLSMGHMLDLTGHSFAALRLPAILAMVALAVGPTAALWLRIRRRNYGATWATAITMAVFLVAAHIALVRFDPYLSSKRMADAVATQIKPQDRLMIYGDQAYGSSLLFYLQRPIELVNGRTTSMWFGSTFPDAPKIHLKDDDLLRVWQSDERVFLFVPINRRAQVDALLRGPRFVVSESSGKVIYSNRR